MIDSMPAQRLQQEPASTCFSRISLIPGMFACVLLLSSCELFQKKPEPEPEPPPPVVEQAEPISEPEPLPPPPPPDEAIPQALQQMELGRGAAALELLSRVQVEYGEQPMATWLIQQILEPPEEFFGTEHTTYTIQPGDSLANLSRVNLGHPLWFYLLARYNDISVPRNLSVGTELKLPRQQPQLPPFLRGGEEVTGVNLSANNLLEQGRHQQALGLLRSAMEADNLDDRGRQLLVRAWSLRLDEMMERGQLDAAEEELKQLTPKSTDEESQKLLAKLDNQLKAQRHYQLGLRALERNHLEAAHFSFNQALRYQENFPEARVRLRQTDNRLTERDHQEALRLLQAGQEQAATALWERILERDPENRTAQEFLRRIRG